jgi:hypothetical protein
MKRRDFVKLTGLTAAGVALVGPKLFAEFAPLDLSEQFSFTAPTWSGSRILYEPAPINVGPAPLWEDFQYIVKDPFLPSIDPLTGKPSHEMDAYKSTIGWKGTYQGRTYGDYVVIKDGPRPLEPRLVSDACVLLKEQADQTRHQLIVDANIPCFCLECKVRAFSDCDTKRTGHRLFKCTKVKHNIGSLMVCVTVCGKGKGWVRAANLRAEDMFWKAIIREEGPTHGYA